MATTNKLFIPNSYTAQNTGALTGSNVSLAVTLTRNEDAVRFVVDGSATCFYSATVGSATASATSVPLVAGAAETFGLPPDTTHINIFGASGTVYVVLGKGA